MLWNWELCWDCIKPGVDTFGCIYGAGIVCDETGLWPGWLGLEIICCTGGVNCGGGGGGIPANEEGMPCAGSKCWEGGGINWWDCWVKPMGLNCNIQKLVSADRSNRE